MMRPGSARARELVDAPLLGQPGIDIAVRVDADAVDMPALHASESVSVPVATADVSGVALIFLLGDVEIAILAAGDVVGAAHASPLADELAFGSKDLYALVRP